MKPAFSVSCLDKFLDSVQEAFPSPEGRSAGVDAIRQKWQEIGARPGDLVLLCLPNGVHLLEHFFGALLAGLVPALIAPNMPSSRLRHISQVMGARAIAGARLAQADLEPERWETLAGLDVGMLPPGEHPAANPGEVVILTSGTSGLASGCVFDLEALLLNAERHADSIGQRADDVVLVNLPLCFSFALVAQMLATYLRGGSLVISGPPFHGPTYAQTLARFGVTISSLTPVLARSLLRQDDIVWQGVRVLSIGGDALAPDDVAALLERRPGGELYLTYGLTQAGPRVSTLAAHQEPPERYSSVGKPLAGTTVFLREVDGDSNYKQLWVSSATVMKRTLGKVQGRPDSSYSQAGTVATGDIFEQDAEGYLYYRGRLSDVFLRNGEKISLTSVRGIARQIPNAIYTKTRVVPLSEGKQDYELEVQMKAGSELEEREVVRFLRQWLRRAEMPMRVCVSTADGESINRYK